MTPTSATGACLCGAVSFTAALPSRWVAHCHCTRCQQAHGAAFVTWVSVDEAKAAIADPDDSLHWYRAPGLGERGFCSTCGSPLFFRSSQWPGELHVARAAFREPVDRAPQMHGYFDTHVDWVQLGDALPREADPAASAT